MFLLNSEIFFLLKETKKKNERNNENATTSQCGHFGRIVRNDFKDQKAYREFQLIWRELVIYVGANTFYLAAAPSIMRFVTSSIINEFSCIHFKSWMEVNIGRIQARGCFGSSWRPSAETEMDLLTAAFLFEPNRLSCLCQLYLISFISLFL